MKISPLLLIFFSLYAQSKESIYSGLYTYGNEVSEFKECHTKTVYWLSGNPELMQPLKDTALSTKRPYTPVYLRFFGQQDLSPKTGFKAQYDQHLELNSVISHSLVIPKECQ
jgi:hypothetical protein